MQYLIVLLFPLLVFFPSASSAVMVMNRLTPTPPVGASKANTPTGAVDQSALNSLANNKYADGNLPLGDGKYVTDAPKKGYVYLCSVHKDGGGAGVDGPWIHGSTWNIKEKTAVSGSVTWKDAKFSNSLSGNDRILTGNDLPISHATGIFPISSTDKAYAYDRNPNAITAQSFNDSFPANPTYQDTPSCMNGEVGVMLTGVALFTAFDADLRDAPAHELQDSCQGHPQVTGEYHYHSLSSCINDTSVSTVIGFALDGFPITGPMVTKNSYLTTEDLDECHGITSGILLDGKKVSMYHYVMTEDFPYSVSCFRGKVTSEQVIKGNNGARQQPSNQQTSSLPATGQTRQPPQEAITSCQGKSQGESCSFPTPSGLLSGTCQTPPNQQSLLCVPVEK